MKRQAIRNGTFRCVECGIALDPNAPRCTRQAAELDHRVPVAVAPEREFDPSNLVWRCHPCNRRKGRGPDPIDRMPTTRRW
jgi:5-methylcytosine-specific restriction endonuclease McrA